MPRKKTQSHGSKPFRVQSIEDIIALEKREKNSEQWNDKTAGVITKFSGSMVYVGFHVLWFGAWIVLNFSLIPGIKPFDPFPFSLLTMIVSLEAIFLSSFVLISQNKEAQISDKRAKLDLHINMISQRQDTKIIQMLADIHKHLKLPSQSREQITELRKNADIIRLVNKLDQEEQKDERKK